MKLFADNSRHEKLKISLFTALKYKTRSFIGVSSSSKRKIISVLLLITFVTNFLTNPQVVDSQKPAAAPAFGTSETLRVYPSEIVRSDFDGSANILIPDLSENALYQQYSPNNSAYIKLENAIDMSMPLPLAASTSDAVDEPVIDTATPGEPIESSIAPDSPSDVDVISEPAAFNTIFESGPFMQPFFGLIKEAVASTTDFAVSEQVPEQEILSTAAPTESEVISGPDVEPVANFTFTQITPTEEVSSSTEEVVVPERVPEETEGNSSPSETISTAEALPNGVITQESAPIPATTTPPESVAAETDLATTSGDGIERVLSDQGFDDYTIILSDFSVPDLRPGEVITSVQLRTSIGAQYDTSVHTALPEFSIVYRNASTSQEVGSIPVIDEFSNAINGGYQLFALPLIDDVRALDDVRIEVTFSGDTSRLHGAFIDSLWLEVNTRLITRDDLEAQRAFDTARYLKAPESHEFVSEKLDFRQDETPVFNLRYISQRSRPVAAVREFFGQRKIKVEEVNILHTTSGLVGIKPEVNVTRDGLVSVAIPDEERHKLKPGMYTVEIVLDEGGKYVVDSFDFQWGLLSINASQTEYQLGDEVFFSMGALAPSGNTLCEADLRLYVVGSLGGAVEVSVEQSGLCDGNNVIDVPDYFATYIPKEADTYAMYLERIDADGSVISYTEDTFIVETSHDIAILRDGPTRIYPPSPYPMELTVRAYDRSFVGTIIERVPADFSVNNTDAQVIPRDGYLELRWEISVLPGQQETVSYNFDAPDVSPYLYKLGPATLEESRSAATASSTVSNKGTVFEEHRQWQIASDAASKMVLLWDDGASLPAGWNCISCTSGDVAFERFIMGSSTASSTGAVDSHNHTATGTIFTSSASASEGGSGSVAPVGHSHTYTPTIANASNTPPFRTLRVIEAVSAGEQTIPAGAIAIFDLASSSLPSGWTRYTTQDGYFPMGDNTVGTTGGAETHTHGISGTTGASSGAGTNNRGGGTKSPGASDTHTHTVTATSGSADHQPPYVEVVLAKLGADATPPNNMIAMWTGELPTGWVSISDEGDAFGGKFFKASTTYGATGGALTHTHADVTGITTSVPSAIVDPARIGTAGADDAHTHSAEVVDFSTESNLPPYVTMVIAKRAGTNPVFEQLSYRWFVNENAEPPTDPWPSGVVDLNINESIGATSTVLGDGDQIRLRVNVEVTNATSTAGTGYKLQYGATNGVCNAVSSWFDVGDSASSTLWVGKVNVAVSDGATLSSTTLASTTVSETYEDDGVASTSPSDINPGAVGEWDWSLENNGAAAGTLYCFRMVESDGTNFSTYTNYPRLITDSAPNAPTLSKLFDNEKTTTVSGLTLQFVTADPEGDDVHYQVQIDNNYDFGSTLEDKNSISNSSQFENLVSTSDKAPFTGGQLMEFTSAATFTNGTTYYWRVRANDPDGSGSWGAWSTPFSFTIDTSLTASAWFQTETEQFDTNTLVGIDTASDQMDLASGSTTGTTTSSAVTFADGEQGTAWDSLEFNDTETSGSVTYRVEYYTDSGTWELVPDTDLSGNSAGFGASPVSLLTMDVDTYGQIRVVASLVNSGGSPSIQDWTVKWGYRVETPTVTALFPNEQIGTNTPSFIFSTTDPQDDDLTYQIQWSTDKTFAASTTRTSDVDTGFADVSSSTDTDPFGSGDVIKFTIQGVDALTASTTYWWRVRAKDPLDADAYSFWTEEQSFTYYPGTSVSTWHQTTEEQFDTDVLSGTSPLPSDVLSVATTAVEAMLVYGEGTTSTPKYRQWDGTEWSAEGNMLDVGAPVRWAVVRAGTTREEYVAAIGGTDADLNLQVFSVGEWGNAVEASTNSGDTTARNFDIAYETSSGDAIVAYCAGTEAAYRVWNGSSWSGETTITTNSTSDCRWIEMVSDPVSDEITMVVRDSGGTEYEGLVWNGSGWGNSNVFGAARNSTYSGVSIMYEDSGDQAVSAVPSSGGGPNRMTYNAWNGSTWLGGTTQTIDGRLYWSEIDRNVGTDDMVLCYQNDNSDVQAIRWTGSAWAGDTELTANVNADTDPAFDCVYQTTSGNEDTILAVYSDTDSTDYQTYNGTWSGAATINTIGTTSTMQLERTGDGTILGTFFDDFGDRMLFTSWNGSSWSSTQTLEDDMPVDSSPFGEPYWMTPRNSGSQGTIIVSPAIDFTDGSGPYWKEFSWVDTVPGSSSIVYQLQYYNGSSWAFIPNADLPGNETGTTTGPYDLTGLNKNTYNLIRPYATLSCQDADTCPEIQDWTVTWAEGITISGTLDEYDQTTAVTTGTVAVAVNGVIQNGKTGTVSGGVWSISNVTAFGGDVITVFVDGALPGDVPDANEAVGVTRYDGIGDITGMQLYERHVTLGSNDATTTPLTNAEIGAYDISDDEDVFLELTGSELNLCADTGCDDVEFYINASTTYSAGGDLITHDVENNGTFIATTTLYVDGSWVDAATSTLTGSTIIFSATSTAETINQTGAITPAFNNVVFGTTTTVSASWAPTIDMDINGDLSVSYGTLNRAGIDITVAGDITTASGASWSGLGTTTFDGSATATWGDQNGTPENIGYVVVDGSGKNVALTGNVAAETITIGADDVLDVSASNYDITVYGHWTNAGSFVARSAEVFFAATSLGQVIDTGTDDFYDASFTGVGGSWSFVESVITVSNNLTVATGTVTLPTATTTIGGSFNSAGGTFAHNNGLLEFSGSGANTITASGTAFSNTFYNLSFTGSGSWVMQDDNATSSNDVLISGGTLTLPGGVLAVGGSFENTAGTIAANNGTLQLYSGVAENIEFGGSSLASLLVSGAGTFTVTDTNATLSGDLSVVAGTLVLPSGEFSVGGSFSNTATIDANNGLVTFDSVDGGEVINLGNSSLYDVSFDSATGGWTISGHATATNDVSITNVDTWTLSAGQTLSVGGAFSNVVDNASTTWTGSTLSLESGTYSINTKAADGDTYETLRIAAAADIAMWNSSAATYAVDAAGSLYSQDHAAVDGDLYIFGAYARTTGSEYWSYATDFDGTDLTGSERQANVRVASGATVSLSNALLQVVGTSTASTTVANQGSGTYTISVTAGTTTAQYYDFADLGLSGVSLLASTTVTSLLDGSYTVAADGGTALTVSSTTIDANAALQIYRVAFATTTAISASNVTQTDGAPSSYWWFRNSSGNLDGESFDNDTGNPGSIRWDDSALIVTIAGVVYDNDETSPLVTSTCGTGNPVTVVVEDGATYTGACSGIDGSYSIAGVTVVGNPTVTIYLDGADNGERAAAITKTVTADVLDMDLYVDRVIVRHEDVDPMTIDDMAAFDNDDDTDLMFTAATTSDPDLLTVFAGTELHVWATTTFTPGGDINLYANASADAWDGTLHIGEDAVFTGAGTSTYTIGGSLDVEAGGTYVPASTVVVMNATTTGKTINTAAGETITLNELQFTGVGGGWNLNGNASTTDDVWVSAGTLTGTGDLTVTSGSFYGDGFVSMGGGTVTVEQTNTFGGVTAWTVNNLTLGSGAVVGTTTPASTATTTVSGALTISSAHFLGAGSSQWRLTGSGVVFVEDGTFLEDTSTVTYAGTAAMDVLSTDYYNLTFDSPAGSPTFTATGAGIQVFGNMRIGNTDVTIVDFDTNDPALNIDGDFTILSNGTFIASDSGSFTLAGSYDNNGTYTASGGTIIFDGAGTETIATGDSPFATALINGTGSYTITEHATATTAFTVGSTTTAFTLDSSQRLAVGGTFTNSLGGAATTWTGSTLHLYGGGNYEINASTTADSYATLDVAAGTQIRMWNSDAATITTAAAGSVYSMDHANTTGDLYIYGDYTNTAGADYWSYATDFDGTNLAGSERQVDVYVENAGSITYNGGSLELLGGAAASTTVQNQGSGTYSFDVSAGSLNAQYYVLQDMDADGLTFTGTPTITTLSYGQYIIGANNAQGLTIAGSVINANPAKNFTGNIFATTSGITTAYNASTTGNTVSSWRFTLHSGDVDGESFDKDDGNPGYLVWDDSLALITISGRVYENDETTVSSICDDTTTNIVLAVEGTVVPAASSTCASATGLYSISNVSFSPNDTLTLFINNEADDGVTVSIDPISSVGNMDIYEDHVIVRHEGIDPILIADLADYDSADDADILFAASLGSPNTLTLATDVKLIVWDNKEFEPQGDITTGGGAGTVLDGTVELRDDAILTLANGESHSFGGNLEMGTDAVFTAAQSAVDFTSAGAGRTIATNDSGFYDFSISGSGSFASSDTILPIGNDMTLTAGSLVLPIGTTTVTGSLSATTGTFDANNGIFVFNSTAAETIVASTSEFSTLIFSGSGSWGMNDAHATATDSVTIQSGSVTLPSSTLTVGGSFINEAGTITHNNATLIIATSSTAYLQASSSSLYGVTFSGGGTYSMLDENIALLDTLTLSSGALTLASGTLSIGGSFDATGGTFAHASGTILFNSTDVGETIDPGVSSFNNVQFGSASGGWTITDNATTTGNFTLSTANDFTLSSGAVLAVEGVFTNSVGGAATTWTGSELKLLSGTDYSINTKSTGGDTYEDFYIAADMNVSSWDSSAATVVFADYTDSSLYSQDHSAVSGNLYIYGTYAHATGTEYWSYATDFDGTDITGSERQVDVFFVSAATSSFSMGSGALEIVGAAGATTTVQVIGSGTYGFDVTGGTLTAQYYNFSGFDADGVNMSGSPIINSLDNGSFTVGVNSGTALTVTNTVIGANASAIYSSVAFATTTAISASNVTLSGATTNSWRFIYETGNLSGEDFDVDGLDACGAIRWSDSSCMLLEQTHWRWRNDDGGLGVRAGEWYDTDWTKRKSVRVQNDDGSTYTGAVVQFEVPYDGDMQTDFDDLRFTDTDGTTLLDYFIASSTSGVAAEIWLETSSLTANETSIFYMYYGNAVATAGASSTATFIAVDDFEDGNITEYSGNTGNFAAATNFVYGGTYGLDNSPDPGGRATDGIARFDQTVSQGETIRFMQYVDTSAGSADESCTLFGVQSPVTAHQNYAVCLELYGTDRISLSRNVVDNDESGTVLASSTVTYATGWYDVEVDWGMDDSIFVTLSKDGSVVATTSATDSNYTSGGIGFTYWGHNGGWDNYTSRPTIANEPSVTLGAEAVSGGATWAAGQDTYASVDGGTTVRLRVAVENTGLAVTNQNFDLEYAEKGGAPTCSAVSAASFAALPLQASCGTSALCMDTTTNYVDGAATVDLLAGTNGTFVAGDAVEDPSDTTGNLNIDQYEFTELEYAVDVTVNATADAYCLRVTNAGSELDSYGLLPEIRASFDPILGGTSLNDGLDISLTSGTTTTVYATSTVTDLNGYSDLSTATATIYRSGVGAACSADPNNCYIEASTSSCSFINCSGNSCTLSCVAEFAYHTDPTDAGTFAGEEWFAFLEVEDSAGGVDFDTSAGVEVLTLRALDIDNAIAYGSLQVNADTGAFNPTTPVKNYGNEAIDVDVSGTDMADGFSSTIDATNQKFATTTFTYSSCTSCSTLTTVGSSIEVDLAKPTAATPYVEDVLYWGIQIPFGTAGTPHEGTNTFTAVAD